MGKFMLLGFTVLAITSGSICWLGAKYCMRYVCDSTLKNPKYSKKYHSTKVSDINSAGPGGLWGPEGLAGAGVEWPQNKPTPAQ